VIHLELSGVVKNYHGLRPLRIESLSVATGDQVAILGIDQPSAEVLVNLLTGAALPDQGEVRTFGRSTASVQDSAEWLSIADRFGIVSERAVLLDGMSVVQNLALPFSLEIEPPPEQFQDLAVRIAIDVGLRIDELNRKVGEIGPASRLRVRVGRAIALDPAVVLLEHPSVGLKRTEVAALGRDVGRVLERRQVAALTLTADEEFAGSVAKRVLVLQPATGRLQERRRRRWWL